MEKRSKIVFLALSLVQLFSFPLWKETKNWVVYIWCQGLWSKRGSRPMPLSYIPSKQPATFLRFFQVVIVYISIRPWNFRFRGLIYFTAVNICFRKSPAYEKSRQRSGSHSVYCKVVLDGTWHLKGPVVCVHDVEIEARTTRGRVGGQEEDLRGPCAATSFLAPV